MTSNGKFKKNDYIVLLQGPQHDGFYLNCVYKQRIDDEYLRVYKDSNGKENGWSEHPFDKSCNNDWRYAHPDEIIIYNYHNKPCKSIYENNKDDEDDLSFPSWNSVNKETQKMFLRSIIEQLITTPKAYGEYKRLNKMLAKIKNEE